VARGIVFGPPLLLMDEPLGALDRNLREDLQGEIKRIHRELGTTFVYVTHDQQEALALSDRIAVFRDGKIEQLGTPAEIYRTPRTVFVARFMGDSNIFTGAYTEANGRAALKGEGFTLRLIGGGANGSRASILVRPENISIRDEKGSSDENSLSGHVADIVYLGPQSRLSVDVPGHGIVTVTASAAAAQSWARGKQVHLSWKIEDGVLLEDAAPAVEATQEVLP
jgi:putative spermidine/putrescine transport system ATP-binding protein